VHYTYAQSAISLGRDGRSVVLRKDFAQGVNLATHCEPDLQTRRRPQRTSRWIHASGCAELPSRSNYGRLRQQQLVISVCVRIDARFYESGMNFVLSNQGLIAIVRAR
jgi:hypothetical protein